MAFKKKINTQQKDLAKPFGLNYGYRRRKKYCHILATDFYEMGDKKFLPPKFGSLTTESFSKYNIRPNESLTEKYMRRVGETELVKNVYENVLDAVLVEAFGKLPHNCKKLSCSDWYCYKLKEKLEKKKINKRRG